MKEAERALFLLFISVEFWQEKRKSVDGWMEREGVRRRRARDASARGRQGSPLVSHRRRRCRGLMMRNSPANLPLLVKKTYMPAQ